MINPFRYKVHTFVRGYENECHLLIVSMHLFTWNEDGGDELYRLKLRVKFMNESSRMEWKCDPAETPCRINVIYKTLQRICDNKLSSQCGITVWGSKVVRSDGEKFVASGPFRHQGNKSQILTRWGCAAQDLPRSGGPKDGLKSWFIHVRAIHSWFLTSFLTGSWKGKARRLCVNDGGIQKLKIL